MADEIAIKVEHVSKTFKLPHEKQSSLKGALISSFRGGKRSFERQQVLDDVSFEVKNGEFFGIVGRNGSGKSTLLKILAGIYNPSKGSTQVNGKLTPFIELGVGFNPELTGRENIFLNGALLGFNRKEMLAMFDGIVEFAELERFIDQKLKNYSSGMQVRLAFSIAIKVNSDVLLLDEVLAVGDAAFQKKCFDFFRQLKKDKRTVIFISHDMNAVREYCDKAILIEKGKVLQAGSPDEVAIGYTKLFMRAEHTNALNENQARWGTREVLVNKIGIHADTTKVNIDIVYKAEQDVMNPVFGISIYNPIGVKVFETNTKWKKTKTGSFKKNASILVNWKIPNIFTNGVHTLTVAAADADGAEIYDWWDEAKSFSVDKDMVTTGLVMPEHQVAVSLAVK